MKELTPKDLEALQRIKDAENDRTYFLLFEAGLLLLVPGILVSSMPLWLEILEIASACGLIVTAIVRRVLVSLGKAEPRPARYVKIIFSIQIALFLTALLISGICDSDTVAIVFAGAMLALNVASWFLTRSK